tara:strand:+ start:350 stop:598 length:249 start_codon:yes stop_codon:yes gene_type:complete
MIKCVLLNAHCTLIAEVVEVDAEIGDPNCKLINPYVYNSLEDMKPWKSDITNQTEFMIRSENILTILNPTGTIIDKYTELTA